MTEVGLFVSTFGGAGIFIWYLINEKNTSFKQLVSSIDKLSETVRTGNSDTQAGIDDMTIAIFDLLDYVMPSHAHKRQTRDIRSMIDQRRVERQQSEVISKFNN